MCDTEVSVLMYFSSKFVIILRSLVRVRVGVRVTDSRSESHSRGPRPRRLTKALEPPSQCPMGADRSHGAPDDDRAGGWCVCARDARQAADRACSSSSSGSNPRSTTNDRMLNQSISSVRP
jgi:hypothetical protein